MVSRTNERWQRKSRRVGFCVSLFRKGLGRTRAGEGLESTRPSDILLTFNTKTNFDPEGAWGAGLQRSRKKIRKYAHDVAGRGTGREGGISGLGWGEERVGEGGGQRAHPRGY